MLLKCTFSPNTSWWLFDTKTPTTTAKNHQWCNNYHCSLVVFPLLLLALLFSAAQANATTVATLWWHMDANTTMTTAKKHSKTRIPPRPQRLIIIFGCPYIHDCSRKHNETWPPPMTQPTCFGQSPDFEYGLPCEHYNLCHKMEAIGLWVVFPKSCNLYWW